MFKHILVPTDGSELSARAIQSAIKCAKAVNAKVTGFYAMPSLGMPQLGDSALLNPAYQTEFEELSKKNAAEYLAVIEKQARADGVPYEGLTVASDSPYEAIVKAAESKGCDLIFMASHGRKGVAGVLVGSETAKVLTHCTIPVLVCR